MNIPVTIGSHNFPSKLAAIAFCQDVLYRYPRGARVSDPDDDAFLRALLARHPEAVQKTAGQEISHFEVRGHKHQTNAFFLVRRDGTWDDFAFRKCMDA